MTGDPNRPSGSGLPKRRRGESLRAARAAAPPEPAPGHEYRPPNPPEPVWPATAGPPGVAAGPGMTAMGPAAHAPPPWPGAPAWGGGPSSPPAPQPPPAVDPGVPPAARHPYGEAAPTAPPGPPPGAAPLTLPPAPPSEPPAEPGAPDSAAGKTDGRGPRPSKARRLLNGALGTALAAAAVWLQTIVLTPDEVDDPITSSGVIGEEVRTSHFAVRVERVELARTIKKEKMFPAPAFPGHVYLIVTVDATATKRAMKLQSAQLRTPDGRKFAASDLVVSPDLLKDKWVQPMLRTRGLIVFEVPPYALPGAHMVVQEKALSLTGDQYVPEAVIDLRLGSAATRTVKDVYELRSSS